MASPAPWWDNPQAKDSKPVVAHTPDESKYHYIDERQSERMRPGFSGVVIPRANSDGSSKGFDSLHAAVVHVDPDAPDGGAVVDLTRLRPEAYYEAFARSEYPHEVFYQLGQSPAEFGTTKQAQAQPSRSNRLVPGDTYVVPASGQDGAQLNVPSEYQPMTVPPLPPLPRAPEAMQPFAPPIQTTQGVPTVPAPGMQPPAQAPVQPMAPQYPPPPAAYQPPVYPAPPQPSPEVVQMQQQMAHMAQVINGMAQHLQQRAVPPLAPAPAPAPAPLRTLPEVPTGVRSAAMPEQRLQSIPNARRRAVSRAAEEEEEAPQTVEEVIREEEEEARREGIIMGFETLGMRFVNGPRPNKAKKKVWITIPNGGTFEARYHDICEGKDCLALVYDTRYEDGQQYVPPDLGEKSIEVRIPGDRRKKKPDRIYHCSSMGFHFAVGVLDIVVLVRHPEDQEDLDAEAEEDEDE